MNEESEEKCHAREREYPNKPLNSHKYVQIKQSRKLNHVCDVLSDIGLVNENETLVGWCASFSQEPEDWMTRISIIPERT